MTKWLGILICGTAFAAAGGGCFPVFDLDAESNAPQPGRKVGTALLLPDTSRTVAQGDFVTVRWTAGNTTGKDAIATVLLRSQRDDSRTILFGGIRVTSSGVQRDLIWDTFEFAGPYEIIVQLDADGEFTEAKGSAIITVDSPPSFEFVSPTDAVTVQTGSDDEEDNLDIIYRGFDADGNGTLEIGLDLDGDHGSGNEIILETTELPESDSLQTFEWDGEPPADTELEPGVYQLFARIADEVNDEEVIEALVDVTIEQAPAPPTLAVTEPSENANLNPGENFTVEFTFPESETADVLIDLKADSDDTPTNGNEFTILSQRLIEDTVTEDSFVWNLRDIANTTLPDGIYRIVMVVSRGTGTPTTHASPALINLRTADELPLIGMLEPSADQTLRPGQFLTIRWRDDAPGAAIIRVTLDDDATPNETTETGNNEIEILFGRDIAGEDVQDSFSYQIPAGFAPGTYFVFGYADRDSAAPWDAFSAAAGRLIIEDPSAP